MILIFLNPLCIFVEHSTDGAMGLIINQQLDIPVKAIFKQLDLDYTDEYGNGLIFDGGPVARDGGFILHRTSTQKWESTVSISDDISLTASKDILSDLAVGAGPEHALVTLAIHLGRQGQLEQELTTNSWLTIPANSAIIFNVDCHKRAEAAASSIGLDLSMLSSVMGHA